MRICIKQAIREKRKLKLRYYGYSRIVEPYIFGIDCTGDSLLLCYQTGAEGYLRKPDGWMPLRLFDAVAVELSELQFEATRSGYIRNHPAFQTILEQL